MEFYVGDRVNITPEWLKRLGVGNRYYENGTDYVYEVIDTDGYRRCHLRGSGCWWDFDKLIPVIDDQIEAVDAGELMDML